MVILRAVVIILYIALVIVVGYMGMKKTKSFSDMFLGGGNVGPVLTAFTYGTSYFSAVIFIGFGGMVGWLYGISGIWIGIANAVVGVLLVWIFVGPYAKDAAINLGVSTMPEYFQVRYDSKFLKAFGALIIFIFLVPYSGSIMIGLSYLFTSVFHIRYEFALLGIAVFTGIYLIMGGYKSMTMIDAVFGIIMIIGCVAFFYVVVKSGHGVGTLSEELSAVNPKYMSMFGPKPWGVIALCITTSVPIAAMPQMCQKFFGIKDKQAIKSGKWIAAGFCLLTGALGYYVGANARLFVTPENTPHAFTAGGAPIFDALVPELMVQIMVGPYEIVLIVMLLLIMAASMSTLAALILTAGAALTKDLYHGFINKDASDKTLQMVMRITNTVFIIFAIIIALIKPGAIVIIFSLAFGAIGGAFMGPWLLGLWWKGANKFGAVTAALAGFCTDIGLVVFGIAGTATAATAAVCVSLLVCWLVSVATGGASRNKAMVRINH